MQQVMLITGARKGIGRFLAEAYVRDGFRVFGCSRQGSDYEAAGYSHFLADVTDEAAVRALFLRLARDCGRLDVLINNAGIAVMNHALLTPLATARKVVEVNLLGTLLFCQEAAKLMSRARSGRIVNFTTVAAALDLEGEAVYAASKAGVESLTRVLARELAAFGLTVNAVGPAPIRTDLIRSVPEDKLQSLLARQAIRRFGTCEDVKNVIDFFIKPESDFVTGQVTYLGGV